MTALAEYLDRPMAPPDAEALAAIEAGPIDPADALPVAEADRLLDPAPMAVENGYCLLPEHVGYVAVRTPMPGVTAEMVDWWFDWHPDDPIRYRIWHPAAHVENSVRRPATPGRKPYWNTTHFPVEDIGLGVDHLRIDFVPPDEFGFAHDALERRGVAAIVCGFAGDVKRHARHTRMVHVWFDDQASGGLVQRSRFWVGAALRPYAPEPLARAAGALVNRPLVRRRVIPRRAAGVLALHCAQEYANLAAILPELYAQYGPAAAPSAAAAPADR